MRTVRSEASKARAAQCFKGRQRHGAETTAIFEDFFFSDTCASRDTKHVDSETSSADLPPMRTRDIVGLSH